MGDKREVVNLPDMFLVRRSDAANAPIPDGAKFGNLVCSSLIGGAKGGVTSEDPEKQAETLFRNVRAFMEAAGGTTDNIVQITVYLKDEAYRSYMNKEWLKMFPDPKNRPARIVVYRDFPETGGGGGRTPYVFEVSVIAVLSV